LDLVHDQFACGRRFRVLNVVDDVTRECLAAIPDTSISGRRVARELTPLIEQRGKPGMIVSDNGTELTSNGILAWSKDHKVGVAPYCARKANAERLCREFQRPHARELLNESLFFGLDHARSAIAEWVADYNHFRRIHCSDTRPRQAMPRQSPQPAPKRFAR
jgi:transposase InsO family protein